MPFTQRAMGAWRTNRSNYEFCAMIWALAMPVSLFFFAAGHHPYMGMVVAAGCAGFLAAMANGARAQYLRFLQARAAERRDITWDVRINGVSAGKIDDATYVSLRHLAYSDNRAWAAQTACYLSGILKMISKVAYVLPVGIVWSVIALAIFRPDDLMDLFSAMSHANSAGITYAAHLAIQLGIFASIIVGGLSVAWSGAQPNRMLEEAVSLRVRKSIGIVANDEITLMRNEGSDIVNYSEDERRERRLNVRLARQRRKLKA